MKLELEVEVPRQMSRRLCVCLTLESYGWDGLTASLADSLIDSLQGHMEPMGNMK